MPIAVTELLLSLVVILVAAEFFTNGLEHLGARLTLSEGVTGSLFAAVGTALPETTVPFLALFAGTTDVNVNEEIGVGAILGAPLMLSTLSIGLMAFAVLGRRGVRGRLRPEHGGLTRDLNFFLFAFVLTTIAMFVPQEPRYIRGILSACLALTYFAYLLFTLRASDRLVEHGHKTEAENKLLISRLGLPTTWATIVLQLVIGLALLVGGAKGFIFGVEGVSAHLGLSALLLSLLIIPVATELPEKINSILWIRRGKDTLAFGNITGALVFQGTVLPAIGILLTPWQPRIEVLMGVLVTLVATAWLRLMASRRGGLPVWVPFINILLYIVYLTVTLTR